MNAPLRLRETIGATGTLHLFAFFHLNLAFSSIEEEQRGDVIRRCYWPLLELAETHGPIGIEATGFTLEEIAVRDPKWLSQMRELMARGKVEAIGSGYAQIIGPLVPARVTEANLRIGNEVYRRLLGARPSLALVNEQAFSSGLVGLYLDAGYRAILMDWDNPSAHRPEWPAETRYLPQRALGADGRSIGLLWTNTVAFQKLQRFVHGDIALDDYTGFIRTQRAAPERALCIYASDGEIFDFRPGRYKTEERLSGDSEWSRLADAIAALAQEPGVQLVAPSAALALRDVADADRVLELGSAACPVPVKKQRKYNLSRWAVTGRDDLAINAACERVYRGLIISEADDTAWKELCYLWASDFRTHITDARWKAYCERLGNAENAHPPLEGDDVHTSQTSKKSVMAGQVPAIHQHDGYEDARLACVATERSTALTGDQSEGADRPRGDAREPRVRKPAVLMDGRPSTPRLRWPERLSSARRSFSAGGDLPGHDGLWREIQTCESRSRLITVTTPSLSAVLDRRRGLALQSVHFVPHARAAIGGLPHGHFDDINLQADWYTGDCVFEAPGEHKVTDLEWCVPALHSDLDGNVVVTAKIGTPKGPIEKTLTFHAAQSRIDFDLTFHWDDWGKGSLRLGHFTLLPEAFDWSALSLVTHNGGKDCETYALAGAEVDHGAPVSFLVSASHGLGMTEGWASLGDATTRIRVEVERTVAPLLGLLTHRRIGGSLFCQLMLSALELDDTRKPQGYRGGPRRFRFGVTVG